MTIYATDADFYTLQLIEKAVRESAPASQVRLFTNSADTWNAFNEAAPDVLIAEQSDYGSLTLVKKTNGISPDTKIILLSDTAALPSEYLNMKIDIVLQKPLTATAMQSVLTQVSAPNPFRTVQKEGAIIMTKRSSIVLLSLAICLVIGAFITLVLTNNRSSDRNGTIYVTKENEIREISESEEMQTVSEPMLVSLRYDARK